MDIFQLWDGEAKGEIVGENLCTFNLFQGTKYMPNLKGKIIF
jgi:muramoyltetrapeptide carboxypeptidase LdcA involved in peptidoglycan recycling